METDQVAEIVSSAQYGIRHWK